MSKATAVKGISAIGKGNIAMIIRKHGTPKQSLEHAATADHELELRRRDRYLDLAAKILLARQFVLPRGPAGDAAGGTEAMEHVADALRSAAADWHDLTSDERHRIASGLQELLTRLGQGIAGQPRHQSSGSAGDV